ncbi:MAG: helix-turn-helix domain-containing protein [Myxococcota bacterium]
MSGGEHKHRRLKVLAAAERLLRRTGYRGTTISSVAQEADIAVGSVYLDFASKDAIVRELSRRSYESVLVRIRAAVAEAESPSSALQVALEERTLALHELWAADPHARDLFDCRACGEVARTRQDFEREEQRLLEEVLRGGADAYRIELADRPDVVAGTLLRLIDRLSPAYENELSGVGLSRELRRAVELLVNGVFGRSPDRA